MPVETASWWAAAALPLVLGLLALGASAFDTRLALRASGGPRQGAGTALAAPARTVAALMVQQARGARHDGVATLRRRGAAGALLATAVLTAVVVPWGGAVVADVRGGLVWFGALELVAWVALWSSCPEGTSDGAASRFVRHGAHWLLPQALALGATALAAGSWRPAEIVAAQQDAWFVLWLPLAFAAYLVSVRALAFARPGSPCGNGTDPLPGMSGVDRLLVTAGRWTLLVTGSAMAVPLFLGGGAGPVLPAWAWSLVKTLAVLLALVWWARRTPGPSPGTLGGHTVLVLAVAGLAQLLVAAVVAG
ncbi:hypothetical protein B1813_01750 [Saccharomonospora piscinae]|uniref:NADH:ubiquinone oxidoreductase subunit 1 (Chain H) n=1 Tax=Saccharomonospora piscinae TaxID=687388 RepID=A0A1V9ACR2_SACPI|nr:NADH-quinone oxidoreductase subunit H [Saccharomonospora piscinae]OQO94828.1 hypothetical protein B1813_01750 [Saccharomonospora piscinae]